MGDHLPVSRQYPKSKLADPGNAAADCSAQTWRSEELPVEEQNRIYAGAWRKDKQKLFIKVAPEIISGFRFIEHGDCAISLIGIELPESAFALSPLGAFPKKAPPDPLSAGLTVTGRLAHAINR